MAWSRPFQSLPHESNDTDSHPEAFTAIKMGTHNRVPPKDSLVNGTDDAAPQTGIDRVQSTGERQNAIGRGL